MNIDDFANPEKQSYNFDVSLAMMEIIRSLKRTEVYTVVAVKNQRRILQKLTTGEINEEEIDAYLDERDEVAHKMFIETMAKIIASGEKTSD